MDAGRQGVLFGAGRRSARPGQTGSEQNIAADAPPDGKLKILIMDDEELLREVTAEMLESFGHEVSCSRDGEEAIEKFRRARESGSPFDVVILDLTVERGMGGEQALREILRLDPGVKAVASSGNAQNPVALGFRAHGFSAFLRKPYGIDSLSECLDSLG